MQPGRYSINKAFTLVEVVASLLLVGTLLVAVMTAHRRAAQQTLLAQKRLEAIHVLDALLAGEEDHVDPLAKAQGKVPGDNSFSWRTTWRDDMGARQLSAVIARVELFDEQHSDHPLASVELVWPGGESHGQP